MGTSNSCDHSTLSNPPPKQHAGERRLLHGIRWSKPLILLRDVQLTLHEQIAAAACFTCYMVEISLGLGKHPVVLEADQYRFRELLKARLMHQTFVVLGLSLVKMSICLLLLRVVQKWWQTQGLWGIFIFQGAFTIACELTLVSSSLLPHVKNYPEIY